MNFGNFLRQIRKEAGLSQERLAELITASGHQVTAGAISNIERGYYKRKDGGETQPNKNLVILAAKVCNADVNTALIEADYAPVQPDMSDVSIQFFKEMSELTPEQQQRVMDFAHTLIAGIKNEGT